jgi:hypothetical protein
MKDDRNQILDKKWWEMQEQGHQVASALTIGQVGQRGTCIQDQ